MNNNNGNKGELMEYNVIVDYNTGLLVGCNNESKGHFVTNDLTKAKRFSNHVEVKRYVAQFPEENWKPKQVKLKFTRKL
jgi:hypothetical protein